MDLVVAEALATGRLEVVLREWSRRLRPFRRVPQRAGADSPKIRVSRLCHGAAVAVPRRGRAAWIEAPQRRRRRPQREHQRPERSVSCSSARKLQLR